MIEQFYLTHSLTETTNPGQSGTESNGKEGILHILQISYTETSPSDAEYS